jgi:hypothetical protein
MKILYRIKIILCSLSSRGAITRSTERQELALEFFCQDTVNTKAANYKGALNAKMESI